jgi:hypothetical protein
MNVISPAGPASGVAAGSGSMTIAIGSPVGSDADYTAADERTTE